MKTPKKLSLNKQTINTIKTTVRAGAPVLTSEDACTTLECNRRR